MITQCKKCGAYLDPGESCDCEKTEVEKMNKRKVWEALQSIKDVCIYTPCSECPFAIWEPGGFVDRCGINALPHTWELESNPDTKFFKENNYV